jgi:hypothetical protein
VLVVITNNPHRALMLPAGGRVGIYASRLDAGYAGRSPGSVRLESDPHRLQPSDFACSSASVARQPPSVTHQELLYSIRCEYGPGQYLGFQRGKKRLRRGGVCLAGVVIGCVDHQWDGLDGEIGEAAAPEAGA